MRVVIPTDYRQENRQSPGKPGAKYLSTTTWQMETLLREGTIPSVVLGKRRVIDRLELERYVERRNAEGRKNLIAKGRVDVAA
jgi:hypothetical protein